MFVASYFETIFTHINHDATKDIAPFNKMLSFHLCLRCNGFSRVEAHASKPATMIAGIPCVELYYSRMLNTNLDMNWDVQSKNTNLPVYTSNILLIKDQNRGNLFNSCTRGFERSTACNCKTLKFVIQRRQNCSSIQATKRLGFCLSICEFCLQSKNLALDCLFLNFVHNICKVEKIKY